MHTAMATQTAMAMTTGMHIHKLMDTATVVNMHDGNVYGER
jgi:hypothetical protein